MCSSVQRYLVLPCLGPYLLGRVNESSLSEPPCRVRLKSIHNRLRRATSTDNRVSMICSNIDRDKPNFTEFTNVPDCKFDDGSSFRVQQCRFVDQRSTVAILKMSVWGHFWCAHDIVRTSIYRTALITVKPGPVTSERNEVTDRHRPFLKLNVVTFHLDTMLKTAQQRPPLQSGCGHGLIFNYYLIHKDVCIATRAGMP